MWKLREINLIATFQSSTAQTSSTTQNIVLLLECMMNGSFRSREKDIW
jgi:hypothetical protein